MYEDRRLENEALHGAFIAEKGEEIWNWSSSAGRVRWARRSAMFADFLAPGGRDVLEIGCGTGLFTAELAKTGNRITAIDISADLLTLARRRVTVENVTFSRENAYVTTFADCSFDRIVGSSCLHHLDVDQALNEFYRLLKPGGALMFTEPNMLNPQIALQKNIPYLKRLAGDSPDETAFVRFLLNRRIKNAGFANVSIVPFDFAHPSLPEFLLPIMLPVLSFFEKVPLLSEIAGSLAIKADKQ